MLELPLGCTGKDMLARSTGQWGPDRRPQHALTVTHQSNGVLTFGLWVLGFAPRFHGVFLCPVQLFKSLHTSPAGPAADCLTQSLRWGQRLKRTSSESCEHTFLKCHSDGMTHVPTLQDFAQEPCICSPLFKSPVELCRGSYQLRLAPAPSASSGCQICILCCALGGLLSGSLQVRESTKS